MNTMTNGPMEGAAAGTTFEHFGTDCTLSPLLINQIPNVRSPRDIRVLQVLPKGEICREALDRISGASNSPDIIFRLRHRHGFRIDCVRRHAIDRDGRPCEVGYYSMTDERSRSMARAVLAREAAKGGG